MKTTSMTPTQIEAAERAAMAERDRLQGELGGALLLGTDTAALEKQLNEAEGKLSSVQQAIGAIRKASELAEQKVAEAARLEAEKAAQRKLDEARDDLEAVRTAAGAVDAAIATFDEAMGALGERADEFLAKHRDLGLTENCHVTFRQRSWCADILGHLKNRGERSMRNHMAIRNIITYGEQRSVSQSIPTLERVLRRDRVPA